VFLNHEDLINRVTGDSFVENSNICDKYHATMIAGIIGAISNNNIGITGIDWSAQIISYRISNNNGYIAQKIVAAVNDGANVLNCSFTCADENVNLIKDAIEYAYLNNRITIAGMGNDGDNNVKYPAACPHGVIAVGATTDNDIRSSYSNYGNHISVVAPGGDNHTCENSNERDIYSTFGPNTNSYHYWTGTSFSAPQVSGIASLLKGYIIIYIMMILKE
jgi:subtilisin family serine protease